MMMMMTMLSKMTIIMILLSAVDIVKDDEGGLRRSIFNMTTIFMERKSTILENCLEKRLVDNEDKNNDITNQMLKKCR